MQKLTCLQLVLLASVSACRDDRPIAVLAQPETSQTSSSGDQESIQQSTGNPLTKNKVTPIASEPKTEVVAPSSVDDATKAAPPSTEAAPPAIAAITDPTKPNGTWISGCIPASPSGSGTYNVIFTDTKFYIFSTLYSDAACKKIAATQTATGVVAGDFNYTTTGASTTVQGATNYDLVSVSTPVTRIYSIFKRDGDKLYVGGDDGAGNNATTAAKRFRILTPLFFYTLVK